MPDSILMLLILASALDAVLIGRQQGFSPRPSVAGMAVFTAIVVLTVEVICDLNQPGRGLIRISQEPLLRLLGTMKP
jgi:hypothetical protein